MRKLFVSLLLFCFFVSSASARSIIRLATTTSTDNSGLLKVLLPPFEKKYDARVDVIAVGTGKALRLAENGDVDAVLVHDPEAEEIFIDNGFGVNRRHVMDNDFVILGPSHDPAKISGSPDIKSVFKKIYDRKSFFVSRGDFSGTHIKEKAMWQKANIKPKGKWHISAGQGMGETLQISNEKQAYVLADRGTYLAYRNKIDLKLLFEGDKFLYNPYTAIAVNPAKHKHANYVGAMLLIGWLTSVDGQKIIGDFMVRGEQLFKPMAVK